MGVDPVDEAGRAVPMVLNPDIQETGEIPCDTGRPLAEVKAEFGQHKYIDWDGVPEDWCEKKGDYLDQGPCLQVRAAAGISCARPESVRLGVVLG